MRYKVHGPMGKFQLICTKTNIITTSTISDTFPKSLVNSSQKMIAVPLLMLKATQQLNCQDCSVIHASFYEQV